MFHQPFPPDYDAHFFASILHDWDRPRRAHLLRRCHEALPPGGRIFLYELLLSDAQDGPLTAGLFSFNMTFLTAGKQFTAHELAAELQEGGFEDVSVTPSFAGYSLLSARKRAQH
ncbi:MAG TPA: methyltransferase [Myxococcus sp.]|nr:methyltransferase [Myxococcus sp.]